MKSMLQSNLRRRVLVLLFLCGLAGCVQRRAPIAAPPPEPDRERVAEVELPASPEEPESPALEEENEEVSAEVAAPEAPAVEPEAETVELEAGPDEPDPEAAVPVRRREVAILFSRTAPAFAEVADRLTGLLGSERYSLTGVDIESADLERSLDQLRGRPEVFAVAIGLQAARIARDELRGPIVFAQVFNHHELLADGRVVRGVAAMPPLERQLGNWKQLDPDMRRVGLIVSANHDELIDEARQATKSASMEFAHAVSSSDQETLYVFKRLAPQIDGLWLVPDERILSPAVLRELMTYAVSHGIGVSVFSDALLSWGALLSASVTPDDVARTVRRVLERLIAGEMTRGPVLTPVSELKILVNEPVARRLGLTPPSGSSFVGGAP